MVGDPVSAITEVEYAYYRTVALRGVSLTVARGEVVAVALVNRARASVVHSSSSWPCSLLR